MTSLEELRAAAAAAHKAGEALREVTRALSAQVGRLPSFACRSDRHGDCPLRRCDCNCHSGAVDFEEPA